MANVNAQVDIHNGWRPAENFSGGKMTAMAQTSDGTLYAATYGAGLFTSDDDGLSWTELTIDVSLKELRINDVFVDSNDQVFVICSNSEIYHSEDGVNFTLRDPVPYATKIRRLKSGLLAAAAYDWSTNTFKLYVSADGTDWAVRFTKSTGISSNIANDFIVLSNGVLAISEASLGFYISTDEGVSFALKTNDHTAPNAQAGVAIVASDNNTLYGLMGDGIYASTDYGDNWTSIRTANPPSFGTMLLKGSQLYFFNTFKKSIRPDAGALYSSDINNINWTKKSATFPFELDYSGKAFVSKTGKMFYLSYGYGMFSSVDEGVTWLNSGKGIVGSGFNALAIAKNKNIVIAPDAGLATFDTEHETWSYRALDQGFPYSPNRIFTLPDGKITTFGGITNQQFTSLDNGLTWSNRGFAYSFAKVDTLGSSLYALAYRLSDSRPVIINSNNGGTTWTIVYAFNFGPSEQVQVNIFHVDAGRNFYVSIMNTSLHTATLMRYNLDTGSATTCFITGEIKTLTPGHDGIYLGASDPVTGFPWKLYYGPNGTSFQELPTPAIVSAVVVTVDDDALYVAGSFGNVFRSKDQGTTWDDLSILSLPGTDIDVQALEVDKDHNLYAAVANVGIFVRVASGPAPQVLSFDNPGAKVLSAVPFSLTATSSSGLPVSFSMAATERATLSGASVTMLKPGQVTITAYQNGNVFYKPAANVSRKFCINPSKPEIDLSNKTLKATVFEAGVYQWYKGDSLMTGLNNPTITPTKSGDYKVRVSVDGCASEFSSPFTLSITPPGSDSDPGGVITAVAGSDPVFSIFPNPSGGADKLNISLGEKSQSIIVTVMDSKGSLIQRESFMQRSSVELSVNSVSSGLYIIIVQSDKGFNTSRWIR